MVQSSEGFRLDAEPYSSSLLLSATSHAYQGEEPSGFQMWQV